MTDQKDTKKPRSGFARMKAAKAARKAGETKAERRQRFGARAEPATATEVPYHLHGLHAVRAALANPRRTIHKLMATPNALKRLEVPIPEGLSVEEVRPTDLDALLGDDAVHQGVAALIDPLATEPLSAPYPKLSILLDQVTDPHNTGAILRAAAAGEADAVITTARHAARETATMAKAASGAFELVPILTVRNLAESIDALKDAGTLVIGLDGTATTELPAALTALKKAQDQPIALVLGAEGKGLREKTKATCTALARLPFTGSQLASLNVSNAAVLALYIARQSAEAG
ncbi:MAG: TrmH family RNA methyltransferase [Cohaesibacteraceae bacterium]